MPKISIIVPVYNVEKYLNRCINSILNQTYKDFELILVDDGSTDNSGNICDGYEEIDKRVKVIHTENDGVSSARNIGIDVANGKYIQFIDSDDYVKSNFIDELHNIILDYNPDIIFCGASEYDNYYNLIKQRSYPEAIKYKLNQYTDKLLIDLVETGNFGYIWTKMFKYSIIENYNIRFDENISFREDEKFTCEFCKYINNIYIINESYYNYIKYIKDRKTLTDSVSKDQTSIRIDLFNSWYELFKNKGMTSCSSKFLANMAYKDIEFLLNTIVYSSDDKGIKLKRIEIIRECNLFKYLKNNKNSNLRIKILIYIINIKSCLLCRIYNKVEYYISRLLYTGGK